MNRILQILYFVVTLVIVITSLGLSTMPLHDASVHTECIRPCLETLVLIHTTYDGDRWSDRNKGKGVALRELFVSDPHAKGGECM